MRQIKLDRLVRTCPHTPAQLHTWLRLVLDVDVPRRSLDELVRVTPRVDGGEADAEELVRSDDAPFDYLVHTFFEGRGRRTRGSTETGASAADGTSDCVVWAGRGTGKTFLGALATLLDLCFKPGISIKVLGGSLEQSQRMHEHLRRLFERPGVRDMLDGSMTARAVRMKNGAHAQVLAASQTSVRGTRVQKLRCDEVELFDRELWRAAQLTTRSLACPGPWGPMVRGSVDALSTMHEPGGLMAELVNEGARRDARHGCHGRGEDARRRVFRWSLLDVLGACDDTHACETCAIRVECGGRVKARDAAIREAAAREGKRARIPGYVSVDDALRLRSRVDAATWESEMLCLRPQLSDAVYEMFEPRVHVAGGAGNAPPLHTLSGRWLAGMDFGIRGEAAIVLARVVMDADPLRGSPGHATGRRGAGVIAGGTLWIEREHVESGRTMEELTNVLLGWAREIARTRSGSDDANAERGHTPSIEWIGIDPAGHARNDQTGVSNAQVLRKAGFAVRSMRSPIMRGVGMVRKRLESSVATRARGTDAVHASGRTLHSDAASSGLFIRAGCLRLIESLQRYRFDPKRRERAEPLKDGHDHACDALRYLVLNLDGREGDVSGRGAGGRSPQVY